MTNSKTPDAATAAFVGGPALSVPAWRRKHPQQRVVLPLCRASHHRTFSSSSITTTKHPSSRNCVAVSALPTDNWLLFERSSSALSVANPATTTLTTAQEFEPVTDWTALGTFVSIMFVFLLLVRRTNAVEQAVLEREQALDLVRRVKSQQLSSPSVQQQQQQQHQGEEAERPNQQLSVEQQPQWQQLQAALKRYEAAVQQEEQLRNIIPGMVRIVPPSAGNASEEGAALAAKRFLGKDYDIGVPPTRDEDRNPSGKLPAIALGILALLGLSLTGLLVLLSMDPTTASNFMKDL